ncbi:MAG TPA: nodulation protein NfeD [Candidatus Limnocylindrales bacterium]|nr:nodulation protein NfeD [Candidatus Limnocylindrales bacterium]
MPPIVRATLRWLAALCVVAGSFGLAAPAATRGAAGEVHVLTFDGIINPISARYFMRGIEDAQEVGAAAVLIELNTPGGLLDATEDITSAMLDARVPVIVYVTPPGARAASAGTFITMAAHVAAMAPSTRIGAATPVSGDGSDIPDDLREKIINDTVSYARIIADERGRNADWAEDAVRDAVVANASDAVELNVVDLVADSRAALLEEIDGRTVTIRGEEVTLATADAPIDLRAMSPFEDFLMVLSNPNIAVILLSLGSLGLYFELSAPGSFFPGIAGAIAIILGLFSLGTLPINYAGLALLLLGLALMGAEIWVASGGVLGIGGAIAFLLGGFLLIDDTQAPFMEVSRPLIYGITLALVLFSLVAVRAVMRSRHRPVAIGGTDMYGMSAVLRGPASVYVEGELWSVRPREGGTLEAGDRVRIVGREGMTLIVEPLEGADETPTTESKES